MNKPVSVAISELKQKIETAVSESCLPPVLLEPIFNAYAGIIARLAAEQTENDKKQWLEAQKSPEKEE